MNLAKFLLTCTGVALITSGLAHAGPLTITNQLAETYAGIYGTGFATDYYVGTAIDGSDHTITATHAVGSNSLTLNFSELPGSTTLSYTFGGGSTGFSTGVESYSLTTFTAVGTNLTYAFSGDYSYSYPGPYGGLNEHMFARYGASLFDLTDNVLVFGSDQNAFNTTGPISFTLGGTAGSSPSLFGSLTGALISGHSYQLFAGGDGRSGSVPSASANGNVLFEVTAGVAEVPEPASLTLFGLGALGLAVGRRKLRRPAAPV